MMTTFQQGADIPSSSVVQIGKSHGHIRTTSAHSPQPTTHSPTKPTCLPTNPPIRFAPWKPFQGFLTGSDQVEKGFRPALGQMRAAVAPITRTNQWQNQQNWSGALRIIRLEDLKLNVVGLDRQRDDCSRRACPRTAVAKVQGAPTNLM